MKDTEYYRELRIRLLEVGVILNEEILPRSRIRKLDDGIRFVEADSRDSHLVLSRGCSNYPNNEIYSCEFIVYRGGRRQDYEMLMNYVAFYHMSHRRLFPTDLIQIGINKKIDGVYTYAYISVPFFFPPRINFIEIGERRYNLLWIMPVHDSEAEYIKKNGADAFESAFLRSSYGFFDVRDDFSYLGNRRE